MRSDAIRAKTDEWIIRAEKNKYEGEAVNKSEKGRSAGGKIESKERGCRDSLKRDF
jgi:hypothetical protein